ncbi:hypothetical protein MA16_Dca000991 [Dendrobium catenatum]|uniref:Uncharacterized protein n=1 Tax=Dendrobium catenatum TaxID=906689 RepID=A0A2I0WL65_9ASPA|nr:hypothetical protein MA16_Dca000991 [Dendrobium catenatum]
MHAFIGRGGMKNHGRGVLERGHLPCTPLLAVVGRPSFLVVFPLNGGDAGRLPKFRVKYYYTRTCFELKRTKYLDQTRKSSGLLNLIENVQGTSIRTNLNDF